MAELFQKVFSLLQTLAVVLLHTWCDVELSAELLEMICKYVYSFFLLAFNKDIYVFIYYHRLFEISVCRISPGIPCKWRAFAFISVRFGVYWNPWH